MTHNRAEYLGLLQGLMAVTELEAREVHAHQEPLEVCGDSLLVISQVTRKYAVGAAVLRPLCQEVWRRARGLVIVGWRHIPREQNTAAHEEAHRAYHEIMTVEQENSRWSFAFAEPPVPLDPRPDLADDSPAWQRLLSLSWPIDGEDAHGLYGVLCGLRCCGAHLFRQDGDWRLSRGRIPPAEYSAIREEYLLPHQEELVTLLRALGRREED